MQEAILWGAIGGCITGFVTSLLTIYFIEKYRRRVWKKESKLLGIKRGGLNSPY